MLILVRCFSCGTLIGDKYQTFARKVKAGDDPEEILTSLGLTRYCCRSMIISNVDIIDQILPYYEAIAKRKTEYISP